MAKKEKKLNLDETVEKDATSTAAEKVDLSKIGKGNAVVVNNKGGVIRVYSPNQSDEKSVPNGKTYIEKAQGYAKKRGGTVRAG